VFTLPRTYQPLYVSDFTFNFLLRQYTVETLLNFLLLNF